MPLTKDQISDALRTVPSPRSGGDLVSAGVVQRIAACDDYVSIKLNLAASPSDSDGLELLTRAIDLAVRTRADSAGAPISSLILEFVDELGAVRHTSRFGAGAQSAPKPAPSPLSPTPGPAHRPIGGLGTPPAPPPRSSPPTPQSQAGSLPGVKHIVAVGAGKGGVGKSTIAVNLAVGLARRGHAVGLMDGDIYGPSMPTMLNLAAHDARTLAGKIQPFAAHGLKAMTIGKLVDPEKPLIWRGPMAHGAFKQLVEQTDWGELDYLIIDLPPGTGDVALTMAQLLQLTGAVVVCTPQRVAQDDAVRATRMFQQLGIDVLGVVENMSFFIADDLTPPREYDLFGRGGAEQMARRLGLPFLGAVPVTIALRQNSDRGEPIANFRGGTPLAASLDTLVQNLESQVALASLRHGRTKPTLTIT